MKYFYLLSSGLLVSAVHAYIVWRHRGNRKYSLSEHAITTRKTHLLYFIAHVYTEVAFLLFSYQFFVIEHQLYWPYYLNIAFAILDFIQALLPSSGKTEKIHFTAAYMSWISYLLAGVLALLMLHIVLPYFFIAISLLVPILGMFAYMHVNRSKLYPYQLTIVPLFVVYLLVIVLGAR